MTLFSTGEVSQKLNLSLRTLRYYDQIGLAVPSIKEESGKRYYSEEDMLLLEKIILLKSTSMSLKDIKNMINHVTIDKILSVHSKQLELHIEQLTQSLQHTTTLLNIFKLEGKLEWEQLLPLLSEDENRKNKEREKQFWNQLFTTEEQSIISENLPKMEDPLIIKWINIIKRIELCIEKGHTPSSIEAHLIVVDVDLLTKESFGDNPELIEKFWTVRKSEEASAQLNLYPIKKEVLDFLEEAIVYYEGTLRENS
ncbi:MerR family transcriptional regulator [Bacillus sp. PS06]|uniref:MerR family transcriptional regulator n=1 Tax=Bacillus sp. PS06 TaxID=2764176 RepID=UPI001781E51D|nr:MerR family transcriptional regulator [Bacillus sp. PS06]MBD8070728.1 MerR family transcriptional regulator [Bacillus sp. PS06]